MMHPWHSHGYTQRVVARDGRPLGPAEFDCDTLGVNPGERDRRDHQGGAPGPVGLPLPHPAPRRGPGRDVRHGHRAHRRRPRRSTSTPSTRPSGSRREEASPGPVPPGATRHGPHRDDPPRDRRLDGVGRGRGPGDRAGRAPGRPPRRAARVVAGAPSVRARRQLAVEASCSGRPRRRRDATGLTWDGDAGRVDRRGRRGRARRPDRGRHARARRRGAALPRERLRPRGPPRPLPRSWSCGRRGSRAGGRRAGHRRVQAPAAVAAAPRPTSCTCPPGRAPRG